MNKWSTSINELVEIFFEGLQALIPTMIKAKINFNDIDSYDDWDNIVESLYNSVVINSIKNASNIEITQFLKYGHYNFDSLSNKSFVILQRSIDENYFEIFINFNNIDKIIPSIKIGKVEKNTLKFKEILEIEYKDIDFLLYNNLEQPQIISKLEIDL